MSGKSSNEWVTRGLTGVVFVAVVMGAVAWSPWTNAGLWALVAALAWAEWAKAPACPEAKFPKALSILFPVPALAALVWLGEAEPYDPWPVLSFLWMIWANDTGAFVVGKALRKAQAGAHGVAWQILGRHLGWRVGLGLRGVGSIGSGVDVARRAHGGVVHDGRFDSKRVETPARLERLGQPVARPRRRDGPFRWIFDRGADLCASLVHFRT